MTQLDSALTHKIVSIKKMFAVCVEEVLLACTEP